MPSTLACNNKAELFLLTSLFTIHGCHQEIDLDHFTVVCLDTWPVNESEAQVDPVQIDRDLTAFLM